MNVLQNLRTLGTRNNKIKLMSDIEINEKVNRPARADVAEQLKGLEDFLEHSKRQ